MISPKLSLARDYLIPIVASLVWSAMYTLITKLKMHIGMIIINIHYHYY